MVKFLLVVGLFLLALGAICFASIRIGARGQLDRTIEFVAWLGMFVLIVIIVLLVTKGPGSAPITNVLESILRWLRK